jgi:hypothetical protein
LVLIFNNGIVAVFPFAAALPALLTREIHGQCDVEAFQSASCTDLRMARRGTVCHGVNMKCLPS